MHQRFIADPESLEILRSKMFRGFPYLVTPIVPALNHLMLLPSSRSEEELVRLAVFQVSWNRLKSCLALGERKYIYVSEDCRVDLMDSPPYSSFAACERIAPAFSIEHNDENRCAKCGGYFHQHKLNANFYKESDGHIWHVPGFAALSHIC